MLTSPLALVAVTITNHKRWRRKARFDYFQKYFFFHFGKKVLENPEKKILDVLLNDKKCFWEIIWPTAAATKKPLKSKRYFDTSFFLTLKLKMSTIRARRFVFRSNFLCQKPFPSFSSSLQLGKMCKLMNFPMFPIFQLKKIHQRWSRECQKRFRRWLSKEKFLHYYNLTREKSELSFSHWI